VKFAERRKKREVSSKMRNKDVGVIYGPINVHLIME
jgi:hypothetical protein